MLKPCFIFALFIGIASPVYAIIDKLKVPRGFTIQYYAQGVDNARGMAMSPSGVLYVGSRREGKVYAVVDRNGDFKADKIYTLAENLDHPVGVAFKDGNLYVAEIHRIIKFPNIEKKLNKPPKFQVVYDKYPDEPHHGWKYIAFGPDGWLYVPVGAPCNICKKKNPVFASLTRLNVKTKKMEIVAHGIRNTVGFTWHPKTSELWFTDNGRDWMGDDRPPCELNVMTKKDQHFGYPYCHGGIILDPDLGQGKKCRDYRAPAKNLGPHVAPLGLKFYTGKSFPKKYHNNILVAEHSSWNRSKKIGYRVKHIPIQGHKGTGYEDFVTGFLRPGEKVVGRPVDILVLKDGSVLISDDYHGAIYRVSYSDLKDFK